MIKVLELIDGGFIGGGQTHILSLYKCLDKNIFRPVIAASSRGEFSRIVKKAGYDFCPIELTKIYRSKYLKELDSIVKDKSIDIIHSHGGVAGMYARFYNKNYDNIRVIHTIHGIHYIHSSNIFRKFFTKSVERFLVPYTDKFICVSESDLTTASENKIIDVNKSVVIKNGIDTGRFAGKVKNKFLLNKFKLSEDDFIIGNISRFDFQKNQRFVIKHTEEILNKYPHVKILLAGDGKYLDECKTLVQKTRNGNKFIFAGEIDNAEDYYSLIDIFIFPSLWEGLSISMIEAMASRKCILTSDIPANTEMIKDGLNGMTFNLKDENEFKQKLEKLIEDKNLRDTLSKKAGTDSGNYSEILMTDRISDEYLKLI
jgi:glycosyltransferase involved in cell wall biosynthesis